MTNAVETTSPAKAFRAIASDRLRSCSEMTLHQLVDEFVRLTTVIDDGELPRADGDFGPAKYSTEARVAVEERKLVNGATRARFGFGFDIYDSDF